jgi:hypothetical protein
MSRKLTALQSRSVPGTELASRGPRPWRQVPETKADLKCSTRAFRPITPTGPWTVSFVVLHNTVRFESTPSPNLSFRHRNGILHSTFCSMWGLQAIGATPSAPYRLRKPRCCNGRRVRKPDNENAMANLSLFQECLPTEIGRLIMLTDEQDRVRAGRTMARACIDCFACTTVPAG